MKNQNRFGYEWKHYNEILPVYEKQFLKWVPRLKKKDWENKKILDVGCGIGRNSLWPLKYKAKYAELIDVDLRTLKVAKQNLKHFKNVNIKEMSIYNLDKTNYFDIVFSIGVIHHLENPKLAVFKMCQSLKSNGIITLWVYGYENNEWIVNYFNPLRNLIFKRLPIQFLHFLSIIPTIFLWIYLKLGFGSVKYMNMIRKFTFRHLRSIVFDQMLPEVANYWTKEEVLELFKDLPIKDVEIEWVNEMSWAISGKKS